MVWKRFGSAPKFKNKVTHVAGHRFDSKLEAALFELLRDMETKEKINGLVHHPRQVNLTRSRIAYRPDFYFFDPKNDMPVYAESKGFETPEWRIKRRLWMCYGPAPLQIWKGRPGALILVETLIPELEEDED